MDFIFMLTRQDQTVLDGLAVMKEIRGVGLRHVGFKDVGVDKQTLHAINRAVKDAGATSYMEVVSTSPEVAGHSAKVAAEIGIDRLLGGANAREIMAAIKGSPVAYYPFPGNLWAIRQSSAARRSRSPMIAGASWRCCAWVDLLAYRATEADPIDLVKAARKGLGSAGTLICAGSVDSPARIQALKAAGCDAFTIGSAAFDGSFSPRKGRLTSQLEDILAAC